MRPGMVRPVSESWYPGAVPPERTCDIEVLGLRLRLHEWGDPSRTPVLLCHGLFDHARGFDALAPRLATGFRVLALDARGHGDSDWADFYAWPADVDDIIRVLHWLGQPAHLVGHSRGGGQVTDAAVRAPAWVRRVVNIDGFGPPPEGFRRPGVDAAERSTPERMGMYLDRRRAAARRGSMPSYPSLDDLVERRRAENPRLSLEWLRHLAFHGSRQTERGWTWKVDPYVIQGFGPWRPEWIGPFWRRLQRPLLAVTGSEPEMWGPLPDAIIDERLGGVADVKRAVVAGAGHFVHMEKPAETAELLLDFLER